MTTITDRLNGISTSLAVKAPCKGVSSAALTLSGQQTVNGIAVVEGDRVLVKDQADATENGIYVVSTSAWQRAADFDGNRDAAPGTLVTVHNDVADGVMYQVRSDDDPIIIGTSDIEFVLLDDPERTYDQTQPEIDAGVTPPNLHIPPRTQIPGSIERFLTSGAGNDITLAMADAQAVSAENKQDIVIPPRDGGWVVSDECGFPNQYAIRGVGRGSRIMLDLTAGQWAFKYSAGSNIRAWAIEDLYFDVVPGSSQDVGAIAMTSGETYQAAAIRRCWSDNLHRLIAMDDVFGALHIQDCSFKLSHLLSDGVTPGVAPTAGNIAVNLAGGTANAVFMTGTEVLGRFGTGVKHKGRLLTIDNCNIAGSVTGLSELDTALHLLDSFEFYVGRLYVEKMVALAAPFEGWAIGNGSAKSIIIEHSGVGSAEFNGHLAGPINLATGAIYVLGAKKVRIGRVSYAEANGGVRPGSGAAADFADIYDAYVQAEKAGLKVQANSTGFIELVDGNNSGRGYEPNPELGSWATHPFGSISGATFGDETSDFLCGDRSIKVTCADALDGASYAVTLPKANIECTVIAKVKALTAGADVRMDATGDTTQQTGGVNRFKTSVVDEWQLLTLTVLSSTTTVNVRIRTGLASSEFLIGAINCFPGKSSFDPSLCVSPAGEAFTFTNDNADRAIDADATDIDETADVTITALKQLRAGKPIR